MLNETSLFIANDWDGYQHKLTNYIYDINTQQYTQIADRNLPGEEYHMSGTFYNSSANEIQVANIGENGIEIYSPRDDQWHLGLGLFPEGITGMSSGALIQEGSDSFYIIGGRENNGLSNSIYHFDENGLVVLQRNVLWRYRKWHVAMEISEQDFACFD